MPIHRRGHLAQFSIDQLIALAVIGQLLKFLGCQQFLGGSHSPSSSYVWPYLLEWQRLHKFMLFKLALQGCGDPTLKSWRLMSRHGR